MRLVASAGWPSRDRLVGQKTKGTVIDTGGNGWMANVPPQKEKYNRSIMIGIEVLACTKVFRFEK